MLEEALEFWGLDAKTQLKDKKIERLEDAKKFTLCLPNNHDIMSLNSEESHLAHYIANYFEINRAKRAVLLLKQPDLQRKTHIQEELALTKVRNAQKTNRFHREDQRSPDQRMREEKKKNFDDFVKKYPGLKHEKIDDTAQFSS